MSPTSQPDSFERRNRASLNRFVFEKTPEVIRQRLGGDVTPGRVFLETFQTNGLQINRYSRIEPLRRHRFHTLHLRENRLQGFALKRAADR